MTQVFTEEGDAVSNVGSPTEHVPTADAAARLLVAYAQQWHNVLFNNYDPRRMAWLEASRTAAEKIGDRLGEANVLRAIGDVQQFRKDNEAAVQSYEQALGLFRAVGDRLGEANVLAAQGQAALSGDQEAADLLLEQALAIYRAIGSHYSIAAQIGNYGWTLLRIGHTAQARIYLARAADLFAEMGLDDYAERHRQAAASADAHS